MELLEINENNELVIKGDTLNELNELRVKAKEYADKLKALSNKVSSEIRQYTNDRATKVSDYNLVKKGGAWVFELDEEKLKSEYPLAYDNCLVMKKEAITFTLTYAIREKKGE